MKPKREKKPREKKPRSKDARVKGTHSDNRRQSDNDLNNILTGDMLGIGIIGGIDGNIGTPC